MYFTATAQRCCVADYVVVIPLSRGWLRLYVAGSGPRRSWRWFRTLPRWPVWRRLPTVMLCRYTGSTKWLSNAPCRPRMFHLGVGRRWEKEKREEVKEGREEKGWNEQHSWKCGQRCECRMRCVGERKNETQQLAKERKRRRGDGGVEGWIERGKVGKTRERGSCESFDDRWRQFDHYLDVGRDE